MSIQLRYAKVSPDAKAPVYGSEGSSGFDLASTETVVIRPGEWANIGTGLAFAIPPGLEIQIRPRSGLSFNEGYLFKNTIGTIDEDYTGEVRVCIANIGPRCLWIHKGDRIAQGILAPVIRAEHIEIQPEDLPKTGRGSSGFGSTGL